MFSCRGKYEIRGKTLTVTELPVGTWTNDYKEFLESLIEKKTINDFREKHTDKNVFFEIDCSKDPDPGMFKLESTIRTTNMHAFDASGKIKKYDNPLEIIRDWFAVRSDMYVKRKTYMLEDLRRRLTVAQNKSRFIRMINAGELVITKRSETDIVDDLKRLEFYEINETYSYLLDMKISTLTIERAEKLHEEAKNLENEYAELNSTTTTTMWKTDLDRMTVCD